MPELTPLSEGAESLSPLVESFFVPGFVIPGTLPATTLLPGSSTLPRDNVVVPDVPGLHLSPLAEEV